jgi:tRNA(fMet)-specific endonuclease VapC
MLYMLDTNICGYIIRNKPLHIRDKFKSIEKDHEITLSSIVVSELLYGAIKKESPKLTKLVKSFIDGFTIHDFDEAAAYEYANIRKRLEQRGEIIGSNDLFISAHAKALSATLVTNNQREFSRVDGLRVENWI